MLNKYFYSCFNKSCPPMSVHPPSPPPFPCPQDLKGMPSEVFQLHSSFPSDTSPGLDKISAPILKATAQSISSPLSLIFNSSLSSDTFPADWKNSDLSLYLSLKLLLPRSPPLTTAQSLSYHW